MLNGKRCMITNRAQVQNVGSAGLVASGAAKFNRYSIRYAGTGDARRLDRIQRESFGSSTPHTPYSRELRREGTRYLVAERSRSVDEVQTRRERAVGWSSNVFRRLSLLLNGSGTGDSGLVSSRMLIAGFVGVLTAMEQAHIVVIAVRPDERGGGVGDLLMMSALKEALDSGASIATLEVRKSNIVARSLYRKYGFIDVGIRHKYYENNEDAVIMTLMGLRGLHFRRLLERRMFVYENRWGRLEFEA